MDPAWAQLLEQKPELAVLVDGDDAAQSGGLPGFLTAAADLLEQYFALEDPRRLEPAERELRLFGLFGKQSNARGLLVGANRSAGSARGPAPSTTPAGPRAAAPG